MVKLASCKSALTTPPPHPLPTPGGLLYSSKAVVPVLALLFVALWFILRGDLFYVLPVVILFLCFFFSSFSIAITSLGEERVNLSAFRTFVRFVLVRICRFPLPLGVWEGLRFVIMTLPGLFSYLFFILGYPKCAQRRFWSDCTKAQADLNLRSAHLYVGTVSNVLANLIIILVTSRTRG